MYLIRFITKMIAPSTFGVVANLARISFKPYPRPDQTFLQPDCVRRLVALYVFVSALDLFTGFRPSGSRCSGSFLFKTACSPG